MDRLFEYMLRQLEFAPKSFTRYAYDRIDWDGRMLGIVGPRGVGKTTLLLQRIALEHSLEDTLYVSADHFYFSTHSLYETAETFNKHGGLNLFIDEVHKYPGWSRELKMMYDSLPDMNIRFTGSSILDIAEGEADLSRRTPLYHMQSLSFREYLQIRHDIAVPALPLEGILANEARIPGVAHPLPLFEDYLARGYYPFGSDAGFATELEQVVRQTLEVDIPQYAGMTVATSRKLIKLISLISMLSPFQAEHDQPREANRGEPEQPGGLHRLHGEGGARSPAARRRRRARLAGQGREALPRQHEHHARTRRHPGSRS